MSGPEAAWIHSIYLPDEMSDGWILVYSLVDQHVPLNLRAGFVLSGVQIIVKLEAEQNWADVPKKRAKRQISVC